MISTINQRMSHLKSLIKNLIFSSSKLPNYLLKRTPDVEMALKTFQNDKNVLDNFLATFVI